MKNKNLPKQNIIGLRSQNEANAEKKPENFKESDNPASRKETPSKTKGNFFNSIFKKRNIPTESGSPASGQDADSEDIPTLSEFLGVDKNKPNPQKLNVINPSKIDYDNTKDDKHWLDGQ